MAFIKKNLWLVIGGAVGLVLLLVACVYLFLHIRQYRADTTGVDSEQTRLMQLENRKPGPTDDNVRMVSSNLLVYESFQQKIMTALRQGQAEARKMQPVDFNSFLKSMVDEMNELAKKQGMTVPAKFDYGFKTYYSEGHLPTVDDVPRLTVQVQLVRALMEVLRIAKVSEVNAIKRQIFEKGLPGPGAGVGVENQRGASTTAAVTPYPLEPPDAQGLYTREHFDLALQIRDEFIPELLNALARGGVNAARLFTVVTYMDLKGAGLPKGGAAEASSASASVKSTSTPDGEKSTEPKKREERIVAGAESTTIQLGVDIYRFINETGGKAQP